MSRLRFFSAAQFWHLKRLLSSYPGVLCSRSLSGREKLLSYICFHVLGRPAHTDSTSGCLGPLARFSLQLREALSFLVC